MFFMNPHFDTVSVLCTKQSKAIKKTTLNWEIGPHVVYLYAVDIIN